MKFIALSRRSVFTLQLKTKDRATGLKAVSSWLQTPEIEVNALYCCLQRAVYPSNVQTAMRTPRDHQFLFSIQLSLLLPFPQTHTQKHQAFNSYQCALCCFSKVAAAFAPERQEVQNIWEEKKKGKSQSSPSKQAQVFSGINWRQLDVDANNRNTSLLYWIFSILN